MKTLVPILSALILAGFDLAVAQPQPGRSPGARSGFVYGTATPAGVELAQTSADTDKPAAPPGSPPLPNVPLTPAPAVGTSGGFVYGGGAGLAIPAPSTGARYLDRLHAIVGRAGGAAGGPLLIRTSDMDPGTQSELEEDMAVMAHILQKALEESGANSPGKALGVNLMFTPGGDTMRDVYLEGYGVVFMLRVPYPLVATPGNGEPAGQEEEKGSEWEKARREVIGQPPDGDVLGAQSEPYREELVIRLKQVLLEALKNANHIRALKAEDSVTLCVIGGPGMRPVTAVRSTPAPPPRTLRTAGTARVATATVTREDATVLTIRVSKADVENFAKGKLDLDGFRKKAKITTYGAFSGERGAGMAGGGFGIGLGR